MRKRITLLCTVALVLAACGEDGPTADTAPRTIKPVAGCGAAGWTDPADLAADRKPARCEPGAPAPQRLAGKRRLTVAMSTLSAEYIAPLHVAKAKDEFAKEGLDIEMKVLPTPESLPLLAKGDVDVLWAAPEAAVVNGVRSGFDIRWVAGNFSAPPGSKSGLWMREDVSGGDLTVGTMIGKGSVIMYPMEEALATHDIDPGTVEFQQLGSADVLTALQNGGVDAAWLLDPVWQRVDGADGYAFLGGQPEGEPLGGALFGPNLLTEDPDAGVAFLRAYIRTVNTYFADDYKEDDAFVAELAQLLGLDEQILRSVPPLRMDWEIRAGTAGRLQRAYRDAGVVEGDPLPESGLVDRSLYAEAVGHRP